jgi:hypothetical protein
MSRMVKTFLFIGLLQISCGENDPLFILQNPTKTNIDFRNDLSDSTDFNILNYIYYYNGGGVSIGDINNDGFPDLFFTANEGTNKLYLNKGNLVFEDISGTSGISKQKQWSTGSSMADLNGDGLLDIYVCNLGGGYQGKTGKNELFINQGNNTFIESAKLYGLDFSGYSTQATFIDYDNDDDLDVFLLNHSVHTDRSYGDRERISSYEGIHSGDRLFQNNSDHDAPLFTDVTSVAKINSSPIGYGLGVSTSDINNDGFIDIYVSNDFHENDYLYINNGDGTFTESSQTAMEHVSRYSMGNDIADFNNDGFSDIITLDMLPEDMTIFQRSAVEDSYDLRDLKLRFGYGHQVVRNTLQLNMGDGTFVDIAPIADVDATDWSWGPLLSDFDNDGFKDLFITNGIYRRPNDLDYINYYSNENIKRSIANGINENNLSIIDKMPTDKISNYIFSNGGDLKFHDRTVEWGLDQVGFSNGASYADLDLDGDLEIVTNNINDLASLYENKSDSRVKKYLKIKLKGAGKNTSGIGAKVYVKTSNGTFYQEQTPVRGFQSSMDHSLTFGLGERVELIDSVITVWPGGKYQINTDIRVNSTLELDKQNAFGDYYKEKMPPNRQLLFSEATDSVKLDFQHQENTFYDKNREILIPHSVSKEGPKVAVADVNKDGFEDLFIGGSRKSPAKLFLQDGEGKWVYSQQTEIEKDSLAEDVESLFIDIDNDDDLDLYVTSGGNEYWGKSVWLKDRVYKNDGHGNFTKHNFDFEGNNVNNSCVVAGDYDNDGDLDLFLGGRVEPWKYGITPKSYLLENDGNGNFRDITSSKAEDLQNIGMVTDAVWADINMNGTLELVVVGEWMPISIFENNDDKFVDITDRWGLFGSNGLWNTIVSDDFDKDGDIDFVVGNYGLNSRFEASQDEPLTLFIKDFDQNDKTDPIIGLYVEGKLFPLATLNELFEQLPYLKKKFPKYSDFSGKTITDIFSSKELKGATKKTVTVLESVYLENNGGASFEMNKLPNEVQFSPIYSIASYDFDEDGYLDLLLGGNMFMVNPNLGRHDASQGWFLKAKGDGTFQVQYPFNSGFASKGQIRDLEVYHSSNGIKIVVVARNNDTPQFFEIKGK